MIFPPGVPALAANIAFNAVVAVASDGLGVLAGFLSPKWGLYDQSGAPVITADSVLAVEVSRDSNISKYPVEQGGFESYNKVQVPFAVKFTFTKGGTISERTAFLNAIVAAQNSLTLFNGVTPEYIYKNVSIDHYDLRRTSKNGVTLLTVDVWLEEIRVAPPIQFSTVSPSTNAGTATGVTTPGGTLPQLTSVLSPDAVSQMNLGTVQAIAASSQISSPPTIDLTSGSGNITPATIVTSAVRIINPLGNVVPSAVPSALGSIITWRNQMGTGFGAAASVFNSPTTKAITGYLTVGGLNIAVNQVTHINPPGFTTVR